MFAAWCDLREAVPLTFGYMMSAKVGTGIVAELGAMRISEEIDALEVMGIDSMTFLCATRLLAAWIVLPFMYISAIGVAYLGSYLAVVQQVGYVSSGGYLLVFWQFQNPPDFLFSLIKGMMMATAIVLVGCYYGYNASGGPVGVGTATAKSMVLNLVLVNLIGMLGTAGLLGRQTARPDRGVKLDREIYARLATLDRAHEACARGLGGEGDAAQLAISKSFFRYHVGMSTATRRKTSFEIDTAKVAAAKNMLGTKTLTDTVDAALSEVVKPDSAGTCSSCCPRPVRLELDNPDVMAGAWR